MMQYLVILLDDTSVSYCHADNPYIKRRLISLEDLKAGIFYAMKQNLMIQFVHPDYELPREYLEVIDTIDHHDIVPFPMNGDVVIGGMEEDAVCVLRMNKRELLSSGDSVCKMLTKVQRLNIVITDIETYTDEDLKLYNTVLEQWSETLKTEYLKGKTPQFNLLTDRIILDHPNHCNAGVENITLAPNGKYYLCPAFYYSDPDDSIDPNGIKNQQLLRLDHAPLCRNCDAYHCRRCVWLNRKTTLEVNTPSHEQCIVAHTERDASRRLLQSIRKEATFMPDIEIKELNYIDPFEVRKNW
jgi:CXXX repeat peptide maturase